MGGLADLLADRTQGPDGQGYSQQSPVGLGVVSVSRPQISFLVVFLGRRVGAAPPPCRTEDRHIARYFAAVAANPARWPAARLTSASRTAPFAPSACMRAWIAVR